MKSVKELKVGSFRGLYLEIYRVHVQCIRVLLKRDWMDNTASDVTK